MSKKINNDRLVEKIWALWIGFGGTCSTEIRMAFLKLPVPLFADGFCQKSGERTLEVLVQTTDDFPVLAACTSQAELDLPLG